eukprot:1159527-Pelagomonas_calceolata.AAC.10
MELLTNATTNSSCPSLDSHSCWCNSDIAVKPAKGRGGSWGAQSDALELVSTWNHWLAAKLFLTFGAELSHACPEAVQTLVGILIDFC